MDNNELMITNFINDLIKDEWNAIQSYNGAIATLEDFGEDEKIKKVIAVLEDIRDEEYVHVGQLESCLSLVRGDPTEQIDDGTEEGFEQLELPEDDEEAEINEEIDDIKYPITDARDIEDNNYYKKLYVKQYGRL